MNIELSAVEVALIELSLENAIADMEMTLNKSHIYIFTGQLTVEKVEGIHTTLGISRQTLNKLKQLHNEH